MRVHAPGAPAVLRPGAAGSEVSSAPAGHLAGPRLREPRERDVPVGPPAA